MLRPQVRAPTISAHLPDNIADWPTDPFHVIGVSHEAERSDVRRAYSKLIRRFRPETHPAEFQQIHEAYELVLSLVDGRSHKTLFPGESATLFDFETGRDDVVAANRDDAATDQHADSTDWAIELDDDGNPIAEATPVPAQTEAADDIEDLPLSFIADDEEDLERNTPQPSATPRTADSPAQDLWNRFSDQPSVEIYLEARQLASASNLSADMLLMLYWMLRLFPAWNVDDDRLFWLMEGQKRFANDERFADLMIAELRADSSLCVAAETREFQNRLLRPDTLVRYLTVRWDGIGRRGSWSKLAEEVELARPLFGLDRTEPWVRLLITAYEIVSFSNDQTGREILESIKREIEDFPELQLRLAEDLESLDLWQALRKQRPQARNSEVLQFVTSLRQSDPAELRLSVVASVGRWIDRLRYGLNMLTSCAAEHPEAFWQFFRYVSVSEMESEAPEDSTVMKEFRLFFPETFSDSYAEMRFQILEYCFSECLSPHQLLQCLEDSAGALQLPSDLVDTLKHDYPLHLSVRCVHLFLMSSSSGGSSVWG